MKYKNDIIHKIVRHCKHSKYIEKEKINEFENMLIFYGNINRKLRTSTIHLIFRELEITCIMCVSNIKYKKSIKIDKDTIIVKYIIFEGVS